ncbi:MAG: arylsulfatase [Verrucomicrobia bacterium]|nr:arylsulfatase [Verrucomicrobiota bacterium]
MIRRVFSTLIFLTALVSFLNARPNVIIVMTDDQGYPELSVHGNPVLQTPFLDKLHSQSLRLIDYHVSPMCTPTRGQLLTGMDAARNGAINVSSGRSLLRAELPTIADVLGENGYATGIYGKWHLGDNYPFRPEDRGFDETIWFPSSHISSVPDFWGNDYFDDTYITNGERKAYKGYCTDIFFDEAMKFMKKNAKSGKPFFTYIATNTPHGPLIAKEEDKKAIAEAFEKSTLSHLDEGLKDSLSSYLGMVRNIDTNMGKLMEFLEKEGLREDTILIFKTDNGSTQGPKYYNADMRGMKTQLWDGGHRVPCFISWPNGRLMSPRDIDGLTQVQDLFPTLLDLCGIQSFAAKNFDGMSLARVLLGAEEVSEDRTLIINYSRMPGGFNIPSPYTQSILKRNHAGVLWKGWRLLEDRQLYNRETDPLQETDVFDQHPEVVAKMRNVLYDWWNRVGPTANEPQRIIIGDDIENPMMITGCEWLDVFVDQQRQIKIGTRKSGYWLLDVAQAGEYEFELRRWPKELDLPLMDPSPDGGVALPIAVARMFISDFQHLDIAEKPPYGFEGLTQKVSPGDTHASFTVKLEQGPMALHTWFDDDRRETIASAYYVYVTRK